SAALNTVQRATIHLDSHRWRAEVLYGTVPNRFGEDCQSTNSLILVAILMRSPNPENALHGFRGFGAAKPPSVIHAWLDALSRHERPPVAFLLAALVRKPPLHRPVARRQQPTGSS